MPHKNKMTDIIRIWYLVYLTVNKIKITIFQYLHFLKYFLLEIEGHSQKSEHYQEIY